MFAVLPLRRWPGGHRPVATVHCVSHGRHDSRGRHKTIQLDGALSSEDKYHPRLSGGCAAGEGILAEGGRMSWNRTKIKMFSEGLFIIFCHDVLRNVRLF